MKNGLGSRPYWEERWRNQSKVHPPLMCLISACVCDCCSETTKRYEFGYLGIESRRLWTLHRGLFRCAWLLVPELQFFPQAYLLQKTLMVWELERGWCIGEPSWAFSLPLQRSSLNQDLDPLVLKGFLALVGHKPSVTCENKKKREKKVMISCIHLPTKTRWHGGGARGHHVYVCMCTCADREGLSLKNISVFYLFILVNTEIDHTFVNS